MRTLIRTLAICSAVLLASSAGAVVNGDFSSGVFDTPSTSSPATDWNFNGGGVVGELLANYQGRSNVLHLTTNGDGLGIYQYPVGSGQYGYADVYVVSGGANFFTCNSFCNYPSGAFYAPTATTGQWVRLFADAGNQYVNETGIYSLGGAADFYIDTVSISDVAPAPEPSTWAMTIGGFAIVGTALRRGRRRMRFA